ncbi:MAG: hypothetical protein HOV83_27200 [Catenulispora sp.]|nr:hypothetical protein [Catenulispora sp.]
MSIGVGEGDTAGPVLSDAAGDGLSDASGDGLVLSDASGDGLTDALGDALGDSDTSADGLTDGLGLSDTSGEGLVLGLSDTSGDGLTETLADGLALGDFDASGDGLVLALFVTSGDGLAEVRGDADGEALGDDVTGVPGQVWLRLNVASRPSLTSAAEAAVSSQPAVVITYACLNSCFLPLPAASSQPFQPGPESGAAASLLVIGPAVTVPPDVEKVSVRLVNASPSLSGTTKCQPSCVLDKVPKPSHWWVPNFWAVVGIWLSFTVAAKTPTPRVTVPTTARTSGMPTRRR